MKDLILIVCYMGKLPSYFSMFIDSCAWNSKIDFLIVTDDFIDAESFPQNIQIVNKGIEDIGNLIKSRISTSAKLERPYKLCDYKPAYGVLFEEYIRQYNFWGHCDIDLIWGDLEHTVLPLLAQNRDRYFKYGHLTLYKNTPEVAEFYKKDYSGLNYNLVFSSNISCGFDEKGGTWKLAEEQGLNIYHDEICFDIKWRKLQNNIEVFNFKNYDNQCFIIDNGHIYRYYDSNGKIFKEERAYIHFQKRSITPVKLYKDKSYQFLFDRIIELDVNYSLPLCFKRNIDKRLKLEELIRVDIKNLFQSIKYKMLVFKKIIGMYK